MMPITRFQLTLLLSLSARAVPMFVHSSAPAAAVQKAFIVASP
jgi:hypothetical protein